MEVRTLLTATLGDNSVVGGRLRDSLIYMHNSKAFVGGRKIGRTWILINAYWCEGSIAAGVHILILGGTTCEMSH